VKPPGAAGTIIFNGCLNKKSAAQFLVVKRVRTPQEIAKLRLFIFIFSKN
jgi:hypothetical protein